MSRRSRHDNEESRLGDSPWHYVSGVFLLLVLLGLVWFVVTGQGKDGAAKASASPAVAASLVAPVDSSQSGASVCGMPDGDQTVPTTPLGAQTLTVGDGLTVPTVEGAGPGITDGITHCFAHSPRGAVVAAVNFTRWLSSNQQLDEVVTTLVLAGDERDRLLAQAEEGWDGSTVPPQAVQAYKVTIHSADEVVVDVAMSLPGSMSTLGHWPLVMVWADGDWKVNPPLNGDWGIEKLETIDYRSYVPWPIY